jgi:hypothetical protein
LCPLSEAYASPFLVSRSATLPSAAASRGRLRGVFSSDAGDGEWPDVDSIPESAAVRDSYELAIAIPIGERLDFNAHESSFPVAVSDGRDRHGDRCPEPDTRSRGGARGSGGSPRS